MATTARGTISHGTRFEATYAADNHTDIGTEFERTLRTIFKRCLRCPPTTPTCPTCAGGEICSLVPHDCHTCAHMVCIKNPTSAPPSSGANVGAIAGGVVGGVAFMALLVFLVWRFWIKKRRAEQDAELEEEWGNDEIASQKRVHQFSAMQDAASTRTRGSLATSILSRASNIIQIAYIPGVTNRNGSGRDSVHAPVPPIPAAHRSQPPKSPLSNEGDALFFRPGDLRDSTWSGTSTMVSGNRDTRYSSNRDTRYTMKSITPSLLRDSMASDAAWDNATTQPMPATTASRTAPKVVSVKSSNSSVPTLTSLPSPPETSSPPQTKAVQVIGETLSPGASLRSISGSGKATKVTIGGKGKGRFPIRQTSDASSAPSTSNYAPAISSPLAEQDEDPIEDEEEHARARQSLIENIDFATPPPIQPAESPFFDATEHPSAAIAAASSSRPNPYASMASTVRTSTELSPRRGVKSVGGLSAVIEEATKRASRHPSHDGLGGKGDVSPFSDEHSTDE